ncbi:CopG family ribbon-helix-helix protein [Variovorax sp. KK3]|uniref:CopG family ribbon-helix-helix protein n=1 Tax=Variovorax sp. KK3 TaxID=1855728 RepID=UPI00097BB44C|nr:ribbon-helix-helix protein, CopG family [Variovorax sp. KK3]
MSRVTISLEPHLARQLDQLVLDGGYTNRSAAVREMIRFALDRADLRGRSVLPDESPCVAHVGFLCTHSEPSVATRLVRLLNDNRILVKSSSRVPLDGDHFLEMVVLAGAASHVRACADEIAGLKGADQQVRPSVAMRAYMTDA